MTTQEALNYGYKKLKDKSSSVMLDAEVLLSHVLKKPKENLFANPQKKLTKLETTHYKLLTARRSGGVPVAYITGHKEFYGSDFKVNKDVLIPRPETEMLVELALDRIRNNELGIRNVIDLGTGSGSIIISIAKSLHGNLNFYAADISPKALYIAKQNARRHKVLNKIKFENCDLIENCKLKIENSLIVANLPYLTSKQMKNPDLKHEPRSALYGGPDGLKYFHELFNQLYNLSPKTYNLLLEHDPSQKSALQKLAKKFLKNPQIKFHKDLAGRYRVMEISKSPLRYRRGLG